MRFSVCSLPFVWWSGVRDGGCLSVRVRQSITQAAACAGQRAPKSLFLGIAHSGRSNSSLVQARHCCEATVYSHYWVSNSSCMPLVFNDRANTNTQMTLPDMLDMSAMTAPGSIRGAPPPPTTPAV